jgi:hypothetical protein
VRTILITIFLLTIGSILICRYMFYSFIRDNNINPNPANKITWLTINEVFDFYRKSGSLIESQLNTLRLLRSWELFNLFLFPIMVLVAIIIAINSNS